MELQAIIFDLDGTLTESKSPLTAEMGEALARLFEKMPVAVMSGGSYTQFQKQFLGGIPQKANLKNLYLFPTSASQCYLWKDGSWQSRYANPFTPEEKSRVLGALTEALRETGLDKPPPKLWGEQTEDRGSQITWSALGQQAPIGEKQSWDPERKKRAPLQATLIARLPGFSVRVNATNSIDITREGITKAYGVRKFSEILGVPISNMLYVGDALFPGGNDEIVKESGIATHQVSGPAETARIIESVLSSD
ncbi:MAG TPA: HAD-IIB family hydrolase [Candidatus Paceibacterota bacterium]|nr:HAD-IIB family hydrolase [Candidatus Paceibacterota bacterium]